jgi:hypothetical protein
VSASTHAHTRYDISIFGVELTREEELEMIQVIEKFAHEKHPEVQIYGTALWSPGDKLDPVTHFSAIELKESA